MGLLYFYFNGKQVMTQDVTAYLALPMFREVRQVTVCTGVFIKNGRIEGGY